MNERSAQSVGGPDWRRRILWMFAFVFVCLASGWAMIWVACAREGFYGNRWEGFALGVVLAISAAPMLVAVLLIVILWRRVGPPFSRPPGRK